jgi:2',3'-cyclic-nucleotide 2'-phosphodiesterase/3'-nucleotidase
MSNVGPDVVVLEPAEAMRAMAPRMREAGAQIIVVLSHLAGPDSDRLVAAVSGIDVIVGDHAGRALDWPEVINGAIVSRRGQEYFPPGVLRLTVRGGRIVDFSYAVLPLATDSPVAPDVEEVVSRYTEEMEALLGVEIGSTATALDTRRDTVRREEAAIGNYVADAVRAWAGADVGLQNGGGIRGDKVYAAGPLTRRSIVEMLPFQNAVTVLRVRGAQLLEALENGVSRIETDGGRFPQVSGLRFRYDPGATPRVKEVSVGGQPLDLDREYTLATNDFVASGGDGYTMLQAADVLVSPQAGPLISLVVMEAVARDGVIAPRVEGRITVGHGSD